MEIDVTENNLKTCLNAYKYAVVSKKRISQTLNVDSQGFAKLSLTLSSYASAMDIMVSSDYSYCMQSASTYLFIFWPVNPNYK